MNWRLIHKIYRIFGTIVHLVIFTMVMLAIYPAAVKYVGIESVGDMQWTIEGDNVIIEVPLKLKNHGVYDIKNLRMDFVVKNSTITFIETYQNLGDIHIGEIKTVVVKVPVNLTYLYELESPNFYHFFNYDDFTIKFHTSLDYMWDFVEMRTSYINTVRWQPVVKDFKVYHPNIMYQNDSIIKIEIPYMINTATYLKGNASFSGTVYGNDFWGEFDTNITLGGKHPGNLYLIFQTSAAKSLITESQTLHLKGYLKFLNLKIPLNTDYNWGAPLNDLNVEILDDGTIHYSFKNDADFDMNLTITEDYYYHGELVQHEGSFIYVPSGKRVDRYEKPTITQPVDRVVITFEDSNTGIVYREVIEV